MSSFLLAVTRLFDAVFYPFRNLSPWISLTVLSCLTGIFMLLVFRFTSNQRAIRRVKDRMQAHLLEVRLFSDQLSVVIKAYGRILRWSAAYLGQTLVPLAVMTVPLVILLTQMDFRLGHETLRPQDAFLIKVLAAGNASIEEASLRVPDGLTLTAPALHILPRSNSDREATLRSVATSTPRSRRTAGPSSIGRLPARLRSKIELSTFGRAPTRKLMDTLALP